MNPTEEWAKAEAANVVAAIRGLGMDRCQWPLAASEDQAQALANAVGELLPPGAKVTWSLPVDGSVGKLEIYDWKEPPDEPKPIKFRQMFP